MSYTKSEVLGQEARSVRGAVRRNVAMCRQLSRVRKTLAVEQRQATLSLTRGSVTLIAKLQALRAKTNSRYSIYSTDSEAHDRSGSSVSQRNAVPSRSGAYTSKCHQSLPPARQSSQELDERSKSHRNKLYRQESHIVLPPLLGCQGVGSDKSDASTRTDEDKYNTPSWKRADIINKKKQEEIRRKRIYGKRGK